METVTLYVEILPDYWPDWRAHPFNIKTGRILKRQPKQHERHLFTKIVVSVDVAARYGAKTVTV